MIEIQHDGKIFESYRELHSHCCDPAITYACFYKRLEAGWDISKASTTPQSAATWRSYQVDDIEFKSLTALAAAAGITYQSAVRRRQRGFTDREIFYGREKTKSLQEPIVKPSKSAVIIKGIEYKSLAAAYKALAPSAKFNAIRARLRYGKSLEEAFEVEEWKDKRSIASKVELVIGDECFSVAKASQYFSTPAMTIRDRLARGATPEQAVGISSIDKGELLRQSTAYPDRQQSARNVYSLEGKEYTVAELAEKFNLPYSLVYNRITAGWDVISAIRPEITNKITVNGKEYRSAMSAWDKIGKTTYSAFNARRSAGHSIEIALGFEELPPLRVYEVAGQSYASLHDVASAYGLTHAQLTGRLSTMTLENAVAHNPITGKYSRKRFEDDPALAEQKGILYFVKVESSQGRLHKVGITRRTIKARFSAHSYEIIASFDGLLGELYDIEQEIIESFRENLYRSDEDFGGKTETFLFLQHEEDRLLAILRNRLPDREHENDYQSVEGA